MAMNRNPRFVPGLTPAHERTLTLLSEELERIYQRGRRDDVRAIVFELRDVQQKIDHVITDLLLQKEF